MGKAKGNFIILNLNLKKKTKTSVSLLGQELECKSMYILDKNAAIYRYSDITHR